VIATNWWGKEVYMLHWARVVKSFGVRIPMSRNSRISPDKKKDITLLEGNGVLGSQNEQGQPVRKEGWFVLLEIGR